MFFLPHIGQDTIDEEDEHFRALLRENGYDTSKLGLVIEAQTSSDSDEVSTEGKEAGMGVKGHGDSKT